MRRAFGDVVKGSFGRAHTLRQRGEARPARMSRGRPLLALTLMIDSAAARVRKSVSPTSPTARPFAPGSCSSPTRSSKRRAPEVTDCAALVRFAFREALRAHTPRVGAPRRPPLHTHISRRPLGAAADVRPAGRSSASRPAPTPRYAEFADARTLVALNARPLGRQTSALQPGDLLYFHQPSSAARSPDGVRRPLVLRRGRRRLGRLSHRPLDGGPGEVRKARLRDLRRHPSPRWRPLPPTRSSSASFRLPSL